MKILIVDRDPLAVQMLRSRLEPLGHQVSEESAKNNAVARLMSEPFDIILLDPSPLTSPRPVVLNIRRSVKSYPYIFLLTDSMNEAEAVKAGVNDVLTKPLDPEKLKIKIGNAERFLALIHKLGDDSEDFPSAGGIIAKSAINQLFLSAIDRADRYGERSYILQISLSNYIQIRDIDGPYVADLFVAKLCQYLVLLRRQSDIIGQTGKNEYTLLLQRPIYDTEPLEAANRFAESLGKFKDFVPSHETSLELTVALIAVPPGELMAKHVIHL